MAPDSSVEDYLDSVVDRTHAGMAETLANVKQAAEGDTRPVNGYHGRMSETHATRTL